MANINARSPYIITIDEALQIETKIEIFLWNGTGSVPTAFAYVLSKLIPSSNNTATYYDISPYIREFIDHNALQPQPTTINNTPIAQYCNVLVKKFKKTSISFAQFDTFQTKAFNGFGYFVEGYNLPSNDILLSEGDYYYNTTSNVGWVTATEFLPLMKARWTNLATAAVQVLPAPLGLLVRDVSRVYLGWESDGNKLEILDANDVVLWTSYFYPKEECKYVPVQIDFVNKFGAWQREWFYKASFDSLKIENSDYNLMTSSYPDYEIIEGQRKVFNANGQQSIKVNSDWVKESYKETIQQLMLSERILVNELPAKLNTKSIDLQKQLNTRLINYQLDFDFAYDIINTVV
jgi:hypothetical protein